MDREKEEKFGEQGRDMQGKGEANKGERNV